MADTLTLLPCITDSACNVEYKQRACWRGEDRRFFPQNLQQRAAQPAWQCTLACKQLQTHMMHAQISVVGHDLVSTPICYPRLLPSATFAMLHPPEVARHSAKATPAVYGGVDACLRIGSLPTDHTLPFSDVKPSLVVSGLKDP